ncbi:MAG TPA: acyl-CoA thioesterase [Nannocystaceae bacterium]|nr:acyl-CoA thioesterase [Nannocystaceae bacterium]
MTPRLHETTVELTVPFHDVDPLGVVWHGHYYKYLEHARSAMLVPLGLDGEELLATGHKMFVVDTRCRYTGALHYRDHVRVVAWLKEWEHRFWISYEVANVTRECRSARAHTVLAVTDLEGRLLFDVPPVLLDRVFAP